MVDNALKDDLLDGATKQLALEKIAELYLPYHSMVGDFYDQMYGNAGLAGLFYPTNRPFDPSRNIVDGMA